MDLLVTEGDETHSAPCQFPGIQLRAVFFFQFFLGGLEIHENGSWGRKRTIRLDEEASRFFFLFFFWYGSFSKASPKKRKKKASLSLGRFSIPLGGVSGL